MIRRAPWRSLRGDVERTQAKIAASFGLVALTGLRILADEPYVEAGTSAHGFFGALLVLQSSRVRRRGHPSAAFIASAPWPLPSRTFPVRVFYRQEFDFVAEDEAMASFGDGWMTIEGLRASFSLRPRDAHVIHAGESGCDLLFPGGARVEVRPYGCLQVDGEDGGVLRNRFEIALDLWHDGAPGEGHPVLPPHWSRSPDGANRTVAAGLMGLAFAIFTFTVFIQGHRL